MYDELHQFRLRHQPGSAQRISMKKWVLMVIAVLIMSGCSWNKMWKWIDEMEWEREDQTIRIVDILMK
jgi:hypothetical protein